MNVYVDQALRLVNAWPVYWILFGAMALDILTGLSAAVGTKTLSSTVSWLGMMRKFATWSVVALAVLLEPLIGGQVPLGIMTATCFIVTEGLSVLENAGRLGVLPPFLLKDALAKLQATTTVQATAAPGARGGIADTADGGYAE